MARKEIRVVGFGGQGVVLSGHIIGRAYAVHEGNHATMIQSFGPEARGSACSATLTISEKEILYPYIRRPDILVVMSAEGYTKYCDELKDDGTLIHERDLVHPTAKEGQATYAIPSTRIAETLGRRIIQNIVMIGFVAAVTKIVSRDAMRDAVKGSVPAGTEELNLKAFDAGYDYLEKEYGSVKDKDKMAASGAAG
jgi:2-oxoglutarate ferredoxin oxidoreductase subunit gamma